MFTRVNDYKRYIKTVTPVGGIRVAILQLLRNSLQRDTTLRVADRKARRRTRNGKEVLGASVRDGIYYCVPFPLSYIRHTYIHNPDPITCKNDDAITACTCNIHEFCVTKCMFVRTAH